MISLRGTDGTNGTYNEYTSQGRENGNFYVTCQSRSADYQNEAGLTGSPKYNTIQSSTFCQNLDFNGTFYPYGVPPTHPDKVWIRGGQWYRIKFYFKSHSTDGVIKVWINGQLLIHADKNVFGVSEFYTGDETNPSYQTSEIEIDSYFNLGSRVDMNEYIDNITVWTNEVGDENPIEPNIESVQLGAIELDGDLTKGTGMVINCTGAKNVQGTGDVIIANNNTLETSTLQVSQTINSWASTQITCTVTDGSE